MSFLDGIMGFLARGSQYDPIIVTPDGFVPVGMQIKGSNLVEQQTDADGSPHTLGATLDSTQELEFLNLDTVNVATLTINGLTIAVPAAVAANDPNGFGPTKIGGTAGATVAVAGSTTYIINRYAKS